MRWIGRFDKIGRVLFYVFVAIFIFVGIPIALQIYAAYEIFGASEVVVHRTVPSPNGKLSAVIYEVQGGATESFNTQVSVAPTDRPFSPEKNPSFLSLHGQHALGVKWVGENAIEIELPDGEKIYRSDPTVGDITIEYR